MRNLASILALLTAVAGWFYMFYSRAGQLLGAIEDSKLNARRVRLRRIGGAAMLLLAIFFYAGFNTVDVQDSPKAFIAVWLTVCALLLSVIVLALIDLRLTLNLRRRRREGKPLD